MHFIYFVTLLYVILTGSYMKIHKGKDNRCLNTFLKQAQQHQVICFSYSKHIAQENVQYDTNAKKFPCCKALSSATHKSIIMLLRNWFGIHI